MEWEERVPEENGFNYTIIISVDGFGAQWNLLEKLGSNSAVVSLVPMPLAVPVQVLRCLSSRPCPGEGRVARVEARHERNVLLGAQAVAPLCASHSEFADDDR